MKILGSHIKNVKLLDNKNFKVKNMLYYEKHFHKNGVDIIEYYYNDQMESCQTTFKNEDVKVIRCFGNDKKLFSEEKFYFFNQSAFWHSQKIFKMGGSIYYSSQPI